MASSSNNNYLPNGQPQSVHNKLPVPGGSSSAQQSQNHAVSRQQLQGLIKTVDENVLIDEETEDILLHYSDEVLEQIITGACELAVHRRATAVGPQDIKTYLERIKGKWTSGDEKEVKPPKKVVLTDAHKQRVALIKKTLKKY